jgi:chlorite dismutase
MTPIPISFAAGEVGAWEIESIEAISGPALAPAARLAMIDAQGPLPGQTTWILRGTTSNTRYSTRSELARLAERQAGLGRPHASCGVLIPIRKSAAWWAMAQDERRAILEEKSRHIAIGLEYLPAIARRLIHSRDLGQPFDFLTWFEFAPEHADAFQILLARLRETVEWRHVEHEVEIRVSRTVEAIGPGR